MTCLQQIFLITIYQICLHFYALLIQEMTHGRIYFLIGTGNTVTKIAQHTGQRPHGRSADGNQMDALDNRGNPVAGIVQGHGVLVYGCEWKAVCEPCSRRAPPRQMRDECCIMAEAHPL